ncbi:hypothetical protein CFN78_02475 [Amycolatopsis antarctica]|uniref:Secreted protein n=1 Tax=Amycolatopsis antarctica TaxID=1854586 RepID=A0A263D9L0_9PSEU|nr:hypothetical protein [Amycolatopsis antarctica]OZM75061.1 hypothetical protein CFN78_02475 [Amycolatopsis antarctica]
MVKRVLAVLLGTFATTSAVLLAATAPAHAAQNCQDIGNGSVCIDVTPAGSPGHVQVSYVKKAGDPLNAYLVWRNPGGVISAGPEEHMVSGRAYIHRWDTFVGAGCNTPGIRIPFQPTIWGPTVCV